MTKELTPEEKLDQILSSIRIGNKKIHWGKEYGNQITIQPTILGLRKAKQALADFIEGEMERIIGDDEVRPAEGPQKNGIMQGLRRTRNKTRAEQRQRLQELLRRMRK